MTSNQSTKTGRPWYPGSGLGQAKGQVPKRGINWEGPSIPGPNQQKTGERCNRHFWYAFFMLFLCLYVCLFVCLFCLFVAGSLLILMFHFQQYFFPSFLMAESKSPNEMKERDVEVLKQDSEPVRMWWLVGGLIRRHACCYLGCLGHYLGVYFIRWYVYIYICDYMICNIDLSSG